jgi:hypothetical protein
MPEEQTNTNSIFDFVKSALDSPDFHQKVFSFTAKKRKSATVASEDPLQSIILEEFDGLSRRLESSQIQDPAAVRNQWRCRQLALQIINDKGELEVAVLNRAIKLMSLNLYSLGPHRQYDAKRQEHILHVLKKLRDDKELQRLLKNVGKPYSNRYAEQLIKETLSMPTAIVNDPEARRAVLTAWLSLLRQNVGSCFATAPAILICEEQPNLLLKDIIELFGTGRLKRTFSGMEYSVPLSASWGAGDLHRQIILPRGPLAEQNELWLSPGLMAGFESVGIIDVKLSTKDKLAAIKKLFLKIIDEWPGEGEYILLTPEDVLRRGILKKLKITEADLEEQQNRELGQMGHNLMIQVTAVPQAGGKTQACNQYYIDMATAQTAFKTLAENALLKTWEFTLASFSETKLQFASWNLYASLGLGPQEAGGIGNSIYKVLQELMDRAKRQLEDLEYEYEQMLGMIRYLETRMRTTSSEKDAEWLKIEYRTRSYEFDQIQETRNSWNNLTHRYANLFEQLVDLYMSLFPRFFQEVYDADMRDIASGPYDDSPAGFRLVYKYGRANTAQWSSIKTPAEFIEALASFFVTTEREVSSEPAMEGLENDISEITTAIVQQIRTKEFLETAFYRMAQAHQSPMIKNPLENLDKIEKKPWAYTSGGTMDTLVSCYWKRDQKPFEVGRWVENPMELLVFLADTMKQLPRKLMDEYLAQPDKLMLMHSPTHAFLFRPGTSPFKKCWETEEFTYTSIRDNYVKPMERFLDNIILDQGMAQFLVEKISNKVPVNFQFYFRQTFSYVHGGMTPPEFRDHLVHVMSKERGLGFGRGDMLTEEMIDSILFSLLPLFSSKELPQRVSEIWSRLPGIDAATQGLVDNLWEKLPMDLQPDPIVSAKTLQDIVRAFLCIALGKTSTPHDYHLQVSLVAKMLGYSLPMPLIIADTNWAQDEFGFVINPGTGKLEFWRVDYTGNVGTPMSSWNQWTNGSRKERTWGLFARPYEYQS